MKTPQVACTFGWCDFGKQGVASLEVPEQPTPSPGVLTCIECLAVAEGHAGGWRAYLTDDKDQPVIYCPDCAEREFDTA